MEAAPWEAAVILAGGESRRMGEDKALLDAGGISLLERLALELSPRFQRLLVSVPCSGPSPPLAQAIARARQQSGREISLVPDRQSGLGPLEGVRAALESLAAAKAFFVAVDVPEIFFPLVSLLWERSSAPGRLGCVPQWSRGVEPAYAVYHRGLLPQVEDLLACGRRSLQELARLPGVDALSLEEEATSHALLGASLPPPFLKTELRRIFQNLNSRDEYERWRKDKGG